ncbi:MAG: hypothetical protein ACTSRP_11205 [Candidatus Helarchaeota archaeon]
MNLIEGSLKMPEMKTLPKKIIRSSIISHLGNFLKNLKSILKKIDEGFRIISLLEKDILRKLISDNQIEIIKDYFINLIRFMNKIIMHYENIYEDLKFIPKNIYASDLRDHFVILNSELNKTKKKFSNFKKKSSIIKQIIFFLKKKIKDGINQKFKYWRDYLKSKKILKKLSDLFYIIENINNMVLNIDLYINTNEKFLKDLEILSLKGK